MHTLFDPAAIGVHVDGDQLSSVLIGQTKGFKTLLSYDVNHMSSKVSSLVKDPSSFVEKLLRSKDRLKDKFFPIKELHGRAMSVLDNFSNTYFRLFSSLISPSIGIINVSKSFDSIIAKHSLSI